MSPKIFIGSLAILLVFAGCINMQGAPSKIDYFTFEYTPERPTRAITTPYILKIDGFHVSSVYDDDRFLFRSGAFKRNQFPRYRWRANPGELVADYLARDITQASVFRAVIRAETIPNTTHLLTGTVEEFYQDVQQDSRWQAILTVNALLVDNTTAPGDNGILFQQHYSYHEPFDEKTTQGFVAAMSQAMQKLSQAILKDVYDALAGG